MCDSQGSFCLLVSLIFKYGGAFNYFLGKGKVFPNWINAYTQTYCTNKSEEQLPNYCKKKNQKEGLGQCPEGNMLDTRF